MPQPTHARKSRARTAGVIVLVAVLAGGGYLLVDRWRSDGGRTEVTSGGQLDQWVRDGKFAFMVTGVRCGFDTVGDESVDLEAKGSFCLVDLTVKNGSSAATLFDTTAQKAFDDTGREIGADVQAEVVADKQERTFLEQMRPGEQRKGALVFDMPEGATLTAVQLHESFATAGARIALR